MHKSFTITDNNIQIIDKKWVEYEYVDNKSLIKCV